MSARERYSIFDMDRTVTRGGSYSPWLLHWAWHEAPWRLLLLPLSVLAAFGYAAGGIGRGRLKEINHRLLMGPRVDPDRVARRADAFAARLVPAGCFAAALQRIAAEKAKGRIVMLATASYEFYVRPIAARLGVERIVATGSAVAADSSILSRLDGENCYGAAKQRMVAAALPARETLHIRFFSDHHSDAPMFEWADEQVAVNPTSKLRALAAAKGWPVEIW